jgi:hypothetical protein
MSITGKKFYNIRPWWADDSRRCRKARKNLWFHGWGPRELNYPKVKETVSLHFSVGILIKAGLHYGDYRSKLVHFEAQKIFSMIKNPCLEQFPP